MWKIIPVKDEINRIGPSENGPNILPIPPNKIKSPPPIPSLVEIFLYKKFIINKKL